MGKSIEDFVAEVTSGLRYVSGKTIEGYRQKILAFADRKGLTEIGDDALYETMVLRALDNIVQFDEEGQADYATLQSDWTFVASRIFTDQLISKAAENRGYNKALRYGPFQALIHTLSDKGIYAKALLEQYTSDEIEEMGNAINPDLDELHTYIGGYLMQERYLAKDHMKNVYELPQERYMIVAMYIMKDEPKEKRLEYVQELYWALSNKMGTVATPTMSNAGKSYGQLSSCFIDTTSDSLDSIFANYWDVARLSKDGGGIGVYVGDLRAIGSKIKEFVNCGGGVTPWAKLWEGIAIGVDQLGSRQGSIALYEEIDHLDAPQFLELRMNNGDPSLRTFNLSLGICVPDLFMERVEERGDWYLFDPHKVIEVFGWSLHDCYDEELGKGTYRTRYLQVCEAAEKGLMDDFIEGKRHPRWKKMKAMDLWKKVLKADKETGYPYRFYRDTVNRANPNKHFGIIRCSNLCSEITQNQSPTELVDEYVMEENGDFYEIKKRKLGDFVVCNLASLNLARAYAAGWDAFKRAVRIFIRALDNVITLNLSKLTVAAARETNKKYRAIGLGTFGWAHLLATQHIEWETDEAVELCDEVYEKFAQFAIEASADLGEEKGSAPAHKGSEWNTGEYFDRREYYSEEWLRIKSKAMKNMRNTYVMAVAPNMSTAKLGGSTDGIDPIFNYIYTDEKNNSKIITPMPDLNISTLHYYKIGFAIDQLWSVKQNAKRARHIDQSISFNYYVPKDVKMTTLHDIHFAAWKAGIKTSYYTRSTNMTAEQLGVCEACAS